MHVRRSSIILSALGVLLIAAAAVLHWVVIPKISKLPADMNGTVSMEGVATVLNPEALQTGDFPNLFLRDVPASATQHVYVSETAGDTAVIHSGITIAGQNGNDIKTDHVFAIDRVTLEPTDAPAGIEVEPHDGVTLGIGPNADPNEQRRFYDPATGRSYPMNYVETTEISGREAQRYTVEAVGTIVDPAILAAMPPVLPAEAVAGLSTQLPPADAAKIGAALPNLPPVVPMTYLQDTTFDIAFDTSLGSPLTVNFDQTITAAVDVGGETVAILPVMQITASPTAESLQEAVDTASTASTLQTVFSVVVPIALTVLGLILIVIAFLRRTPTPEAPVETPDEPLTTTTTT